MKICRCVPVLVLLAVLLSQISRLPAESANPSRVELPEGPPAQITLGSGAAVTARSRGGRFELVGLRKNEIVDVAVQYPTSRAGERVLVLAIDGGRLIAPTD